MKSTTLTSRLAPTPSGYLHLGNLANFLLIEKLVGEARGELILRIDDCDGTRSRREFVEHIFETLDWLRIGWHKGPKDTDDFYANYSQVTRKDYYFEKLKALEGKTYPCACSRKDLGGEGCDCQQKNLPFELGKHALRLRVENLALKTEFGDVVLWRKDGGPAYHWVSVIDDLDRGVNLVVRGNDLKSSSELQKYIASLVTPAGFQGVKFIHHPLLADEAGGKLSKSQGALSVVDLRKNGATQEEIRSRVEALLTVWGY
jgi:glutamyl/glutaminyl-tRNA synthetase